MDIRLRTFLPCALHLCTCFWCVFFCVFLWSFGRVPLHGDPGDPTTTPVAGAPVRARFSPVGHVRLCGRPPPGCPPDSSHASLILGVHRAPVTAATDIPGQREPQGDDLPFTLSHAAAVLPAVRGDGSGRGRLVPAVLVAGSFAPDMTYYAASALSGAMEFGAFTHSFTGVFTFDVLVAWALVGAWLVLREPLVALLPRARQGRVAGLLRCGAARERLCPSAVLRWYASAALGALTHVVWDAFTHHDRWGVELVPVLGRQAGGSPCTGMCSTAVRRWRPSSSRSSCSSRCGVRRRASPWGCPYCPVPTGGRPVS